MSPSKLQFVFNRVHQRFVYESTGQEIPFPKWGPNQPDNHLDEEDCVHMYQSGNGIWNDVMCYAKLRYACQL